MHKQECREAEQSEKLDFEGSKNVGFDRWGNGVFESDDINRSWDCIASKNNPMHEGVYLYRLEMRSKTNQDIVKNEAITL